MSPSLSAAEYADRASSALITRASSPAVSAAHSQAQRTLRRPRLVLALGLESLRARTATQTRALQPLDWAQRQRSGHRRPGGSSSPLPVRSTLLRILGCRADWPAPPASSEPELLLEPIEIALCAGDGAREPPPLSDVVAELASIVAARTRAERRPRQTRQSDARPSKRLGFSRFPGRSQTFRSGQRKLREPQMQCQVAIRG